MRVLLIDDDPGYRDAATGALTREGFEVMVASDGAEGFRLWQRERPDAVLVDVSVPQLSGFDVCRRIRKMSETPLLIVTASTDERYVLQGFACGADDYVFKPFSARELSMRIRAVTGRRKSRDQGAPTVNADIGSIILDRESHRVRLGGHDVQLTPLEYRILDVLISHPSRVVSFARLMELAWDYGGGTLVSLRHHVSNLRRKLADLPGEPLEVDVVYGAGYVLRIRNRVTVETAESSAH